MVLGLPVVSYLIELIFGTGNKRRHHDFDYKNFKLHTESKLFNEEEVGKACQKYERLAKSLIEDSDELLKLIGYIDLTTLNADDTTNRVRQLVDRALQPLDAQTQTKLGPNAQEIHCAAVCVYPLRVSDVRRRLTEHRHKHPIQIASVAAGFPSGQYKLASRLLEIEMAVQDGATEIDIVINRSAALTADWKTVYDEVEAMGRSCGSAHMKSILATGELKTFENIYKASWVSMMAGSDFIKTSTGKEAVNATLPVSFVMCRAIKDFHKLTGKRIGFKPAGGIRTADEALAFRCLVEDILGPEWLNPSLFRLGASTLLANIELELRKFV